MDGARESESVAVTSLIEALEHNPVPAYLLRAVEDDFVLESVNAAARALSPALEAMRGRKVSLLYRDQPQIIEDARRCLRERRALVRETQIRRHDRLEAKQEQRLTFVFVGPDRLVIYAQDLDRVANTDAALSESQERYRSLVASLPDAVLVRGADGRVLACNDVAVKLFGQTAQADLLGRLRVLAPGYVVEDEQGLEIPDDCLPSLQAVRTGASVSGRLLTLRRPDGSRRFIRVSVEPVRTRSGGVGGSVTLYTDDSQLIGAERAARESAARLEFALDAARMGSWRWEPATDDGSWSPSLYRLFDMSGAEPGFGSFLRHVHPDDLPLVQTLAQNLAAGAEGDTFEHEFRLLGNDGVARWARVRGRREKHDGVVRMAGTVMDVTERRRLEDELSRAHRLESIGRLAGGLAHDFNNLLAAMLGSLELLDERCPAEAKEDLATVRHGAERARDLTAQLLAFARKQPIVLDVVDLTALVGNVERMLRRLVGPTIELTVSAEGGLLVRADAAQLEQVLVNLVVNARDAMPQGGALGVRVRGERRPVGDAPESVVLEVEDHGSGMDSETIQHVFDPFFTTKDHGTGLGLASSYGIVLKHGGDILVDSEPGRGARFRVVLPRVRETVPARPAPSPERSGTGCVLLVDDEDAVRTTTARLLKSLGYDVLQAGSGREALEVARNHPGAIDVLLCDVAMPERSGPEVASEIQQIKPDIRVLFVSGYPDGGEGVVTAAGFLQKPFSRAALGAQLSALLPRAR